MDNITTAQKQGPRPYQEDRLIVYPALNKSLVIAIMDGHGGDECSSRVAEILTMANGVFEEIQYVFDELDLQTKNIVSGTTVSLVYINPERTKVKVAILGDSPVIIKHKDGIWKSPEHNARSNNEELKAAENRGAIFNGNYIFKDFYGPGLQMTRALGDSRLREILSQKPEIFEFELDEHSWVLVASDGLIDPMHKDTELAVVGVIGNILSGKTAEELINALPELQDNVTAVLWRNNGAVQTKLSE